MDAGGGELARAFAQATVLHYGGVGEMIHKNHLNWTKKNRRQTGAGNYKGKVKLQCAETTKAKETQTQKAPETKIQLA